MAEIKDSLYNYLRGYKGKGNIDLHVKSNNEITYNCTDVIKRASKEHTCACCGSIITKGTSYVVRRKNYYMEDPAEYKTIILCANCADKS